MLAVACVACAGRRLPAPQSPGPDFSQADQLVADGCYTCLQEAYDVLQPHLPASEPATRRGFAVALLLAIREKELGLEATKWIEAASALANADERPYVDIVAAFPWEHVGVPEYESAVRPGRSTFEGWKASLQAAGTQPFVRDYLLLATECRSGGSPAVDAVLPADPASSPPLIRYRAGICSPDQRRHLESAPDAVARFAEAAFYLARHEIASAYSNRDWARRALPLLATAHQALPESPLIALTLANLHRARNEFQEALALYDEVLARRPVNRDALLGRTIVLTELRRSEEAIASATRMLELGTWYIGDARYWRAWNLYHRRDLAPAATDIAEATPLLRTSNAFALSGMIAFDQSRKPDAERDFTEALRLDKDNCTADWYLGVIANESGRWTDSSRRYSSAATCYERAVESFQRDRADVPLDLAEGARAARLAELTQRINDAGLQAAQAWLGAAQGSARLGDRPAGIRFATRAAAHQDLRSRAEELIETLK